MSSAMIGIFLLTIVLMLIPLYISMTAQELWKKIGFFLVFSYLLAINLILAYLTAGHLGYTNIEEMLLKVYEFGLLIIRWGIYFVIIFLMIYVVDMFSPKKQRVFNDMDDEMELI